ncbi:MAG TPA: hypothetical protein VL201_00430 [Patescibacteria group bacterium]|jgi:uncharacterized membrane protein YuzA (DUF378 family)|nr:hypothetical protein [Patescibacteria group bacterium]
MYWHILCKVAHVIVALSAINVGLTPSGYNVCANQSFMGACGQYMMIGSYIIGISGVLCLLHMIYKISMCKGCCSKGCSSGGKCSCGIAHEGKCGTMGNNYK